MARSQSTFSKREKEKNRLKKREEKQQKKEERKANSGGGSFESMLAYVDENGMITNTPPDPNKKRVEVDAESIELGVPRRSQADADAVRTGRVDFFDHSKGFGFIIEQGSQERYFVHVSGLDEEVKEGDVVTYDLERGPKGMNAVRVHKYSAPPAAPATEAQ
ncbi:MAG: cold shock domain-containing protein [Flavobacteriales bacterium]|nr:cold shock domain-containing protein [Flavobacteriales bacterium]